ncbi:hypothetical protein HDU91_004360, partial [Kappamyces sp. JEL0680]
FEITVDLCNESDRNICIQLWMNGTVSALTIGRLLVARIFEAYVDTCYTFSSVPIHQGVCQSAFPLCFVDPATLPPVAAGQYKHFHGGLGSIRLEVYTGKTREEIVPDYRALQQECLDYPHDPIYSVPEPMHFFQYDDFEPLFVSAFTYSVRPATASLAPMTSLPSPPDLELESKTKPELVLATLPQNIIPVKRPRGRPKTIKVVLKEKECYS